MMTIATMPTITATTPDAHFAVALFNGLTDAWHELDIRRGPKPRELKQAGRGPAWLDGKNGITTSIDPLNAAAAYLLEGPGNTVNSGCAADLSDESSSAEDTSDESSAEPDH